MPWTAPRTWSDNELVTAALMNTHLRDNLGFLRTPPSGVANLGSTLSTTSTSYIDLTGATVTFTTQGGGVMLFFSGTVSVAVGPVDERAEFQVLVDGAGAVVKQLVRCTSNGTNAQFTPVSFVHLFSGLSAASHTFKVQWRSAGGSTVSFVGTSAPGRLIAVETWL